MVKILFISIWLARIPKICQATKASIGTCVLPHATKTMHICNCPHQHGCSNKMHQAPVPQVKSKLLHYFLSFETNPHNGSLNFPHEPPHQI